jgi:hypothetical protein
MQNKASCALKTRILRAHCWKASKPNARLLQAIDSIGGAGEDRTRDLLTASQALSQLSYSPTFSIAVRLNLIDRRAQKDRRLPSPFQAESLLPDFHFPGGNAKINTIWRLGGPGRRDAGAPGKN